jgi:hypothetical protein
MRWKQIGTGIYIGVWFILLCPTFVIVTLYYAVADLQQHFKVHGRRSRPDISKMM